MSYQSIKRAKGKWVKEFCNKCGDPLRITNLSKKKLCKKCNEFKDEKK